MLGEHAADLAAHSLISYSELPRRITHSVLYKPVCNTGLSGIYTLKPYMPREVSPEKKKTCLVFFEAYAARMDGV